MSTIMTEGFRLNFHTEPPLSIFPPPRAFPSEKHLPILRSFLPDLLARNIIREVVEPQPLYFSRIFVVEKKEGSYRPVIDLSHLNKLVVVPTFKMETVPRIAKGLVGPLWGCTMDLQDAYFLVPNYWHHQKYYAFVLDGIHYVFMRLPFGLSPAPWCYNRVIKPVKAHVHQLGIRMNSYLDDFFLSHPSRDGLRVDTEVVLRLF